MLKRPELLHMAFKINFSGKSKALERPCIPFGLWTHAFTNVWLPSYNSPTANFPAIDLLFKKGSRKSVERPFTSSIR